ncbi:MAG: glutathione synthetase [Gammaproteobacteria bacterium]|nr:glutathione synthetase [Gammaproteobacteria bacterium]
MRLSFFVNDVQTEQIGYSTTRLAHAASARGHEVWYISATDFTYDPNECVMAVARRAPVKRHATHGAYLAALQGSKAITERISVDELDILMLRNDPSTDTGLRAWAQTIGLTFGRAAMRHGVIVLNDPRRLLRAANKMYFQLFPEEVRPKTLISQSPKDIRAFIEEVGGNAVLKPLSGSGGAGVFLVRIEDSSNVKQMISSLTRDGYVIAQEYLPAAAEGDTRLFMMNGQPLRYKGKYAAFRRLSSGEDLRSNIHAGGKLHPAVITDAELRIAEIVRPKLVQDGMFLVGLDIVGDKLMEINVFSPGGLGSAQRFEKVNFSHAIIDALERKVTYMAHYQRNFDNAEMAVL